MNTSSPHQECCCGPHAGKPIDNSFYCKCSCHQGCLRCKNGCLIGVDGNGNGTCDCPCHRQPSSENDSIKTGYIGEFLGYVRDESPLFKARPNTEQEWRVLFEKFWDETYDEESRAAFLFIQQLLEKERGIQETLKSVIEGHKQMVPFLIEDAARTERARIVQIIEGLNEDDFVNIHDDLTWQAAMNAVITKLKETL